MQLQNRLLVIEYSDSSVAATLHSSGESLRLRCCLKPSSQLPRRFQLSQNDILWGGFWAWRMKEIVRSQVKAVRWVGSVLILCWAKNSLTVNDVWLGALLWWRNHVFAIFLMCRSSVIIRWTSVFGSPTSSAINLTLKRRSLSRTAFTRATLFSVLEVEGRPARFSSSALSLLSLNALCHLRIWAEDKTTSP